MGVGGGVSITQDPDAHGEWAFALSMFLVTSIFGIIMAINIMFHQEVFKTCCTREVKSDFFCGKAGTGAYMIINIVVFCISVVFGGLAIWQAKVQGDRYLNTACNCTDITTICGVHVWNIMTMIQVILTWIVFICACVKEFSTSPVILEKPQPSPPAEASASAAGGNLPVAMPFPTLRFRSVGLT